MSLYNMINGFIEAQPVLPCVVHMALTATRRLLLTPTASGT